MNLPASAPEFVDAFIGIGRLGGGGGDLLSSPPPEWWPAERLPTIHCYCFARGASPAECHAEITARHTS